VIAETDLAWYSGDDALNLPLLAVGAVGVVSVTGHLIASRHAAMIEALAAGEVLKAREINEGSIPVTVGIMTRTQGAIMVKAALALLGFPVGPMRLPLVDATPEQVEVLRADLAAGGLLS
jgi:4-hydroxy-tetrahydrodipicolinate synthase